MITLEYNGVEKSLADWGFALGDAESVEQSMATDTLSLTAPTSDTLSAPIVPFEGKVILRAGRVAAAGGSFNADSGYVAFIGYRLDVLHAIDGGSCGIRYDFANAWKFFEETLFQQPRASKPTTITALAFPETTDVMLFHKLGSQNEFIKIHNGEQIRIICEYLRGVMISQGYEHPFIIGTIDPTLDIPIFQVAEIDCASAIRKCLELEPGVTAVWDYTTTESGLPTPTIHFRKRANLTPASLAIANGVDHKALSIRPLHSMLIKTAIILYRVLITQNGTSFYQYVRDKFGPNGANSASDPDGGPRVLIQTIDLIGSTLNVIKTKLTVMPVWANYGNGTFGNGSAQRRYWWGQFFPGFLKPDGTADTRVRFQEIVDADNNNVVATIIPPANVTAERGQEETGFNEGDPISLAEYPYAVIDGAIYPWMKMNGEPVKAVRARIETAQEAQFAKYEVPASAGGDPDAKSNPHAKLVLAAPKQRLACNVLLTNAVSGEYSSSEFTTGEDIPTGIAQSLFQELGTLRYQGDDVRVAVEPGNSVKLSNVLNLTGGRAEWATMNAQVQTIRRHWGRGETSVSFGFPRHITPDDLKSIFLFNRNRRVSQTKEERTLAQITGGGVLQL